jgi:hypothetical protein
MLPPEELHRGEPLGGEATAPVAARGVAGGMRDRRHDAQDALEPEFHVAGIQCASRS